MHPEVSHAGRADGMQIDDQSGTRYLRLLQTIVELVFGHIKQAQGFRLIEPPYPCRRISL